MPRSVSLLQHLPVGLRLWGGLLWRARLAVLLTAVIAMPAWSPPPRDKLPSSGSALAAAAKPAVPSFDAVRAAYRPSSLTVLDRHGEPVASVRMDYSQRRGQWVPLHDVAPNVIQAVLLSEDKRFEEHGGVDGSAVAAAAWSRIVGDGRRGASTISMQLAAMLAPELRRPGGGRSVKQKWQQARHAMRLEQSWNKADILEAYLNLVAFRGELTGIDAVSRVMFGKHAHGLNAREAAVAAALLRGPNAPAHSVRLRACALLVQMTEGDGCDELDSDVARWLQATAQPAIDVPALAPHFARAVAALHKGRSGGTVRTTLDASVQRVATESVRRHLAGMAHARLTDAAVVVLDNRTAEVLAYVGGAGALSRASEVDHARARRQTGSTLKPFLYGLALEARYLTAASLLNDAPLDIATASGLYIPRNYDEAYAGMVSVRSALASSLNIPAVRTLVLVGSERFADRLRQLGLPLEHESDHYGYSLALGSADVDLMSLANAYRTLADGGRYRMPVLLAEEVTDTAAAMQVAEPLSSWIVGDMLSDRGARAHTFGLENALATPFWSAVKTGTSKDMRDNWAVGWSARYTVGVWVGNSEGLSMRDISGVSGAAPIWNDVMAFLHERDPSRRPAPPAGLERQWVQFAEGLEAPRMEYFLPGTVLTHVAPLPLYAPSRPHIVSPVAGTILAMDPDMPMDSHRVRLLATPGPHQEEALRWRVGTVEVGRGAVAWWQPFPGRHRLALLDADGNVMDRVDIEVRGAPRMADRHQAARP